MRTPHTARPTSITTGDDVVPTGHTGNLPSGSTLYFTTSRSSYCIHAYRISYWYIGELYVSHIFVERERSILQVQTAQRVRSVNVVGAPTRASCALCRQAFGEPFLPHCIDKSQMSSRRTRTTSRGAQALSDASNTRMSSRMTAKRESARRRQTCCR